jgi:Tfp pilus assembly protein PilF
MAERNRDIPVDTHVKAELERILASPHFKTSATQSKVFRFVVEKALANEDIKETDILSEIDEGRGTRSHTARANASLIRSKIKAYYKNEGKDDLVRIDFPPGPAYKPEFLYNIETEAVRAYERALAYQKRLSTWALSEAEYLLDIAIRLAPEYAPAHAAMAETFLLRLILDNIIRREPGAHGWKAQARESAAAAVRLDPESCLGHIVLAIVWLSNRQWNAAELEFSAAMETDPENTKASLWYGAYLMTVGRIDEGLRLAKSKASDDPGSFQIRLVYALFLYVTRSYEEAMNVLFQVDGVELGYPLQLFLGALIDMATGRSGKTMPRRLRDMSTKMEERWAAPATSLRFRTDIDVPDAWIDEQSIYDAGDRFPGLVILSLAEEGLAEEVKEKMAALRKQKSVKSMQLALGYMAAGNEGRALASLRRACREGDIFMNWLHLLPLFDPLRKHPRFQGLVGIIY